MPSFLAWRINRGLCLNYIGARMAIPAFTEAIRLQPGLTTKLANWNSQWVSSDTTRRANRRPILTLRPEGGLNEYLRIAHGCLEQFQTIRR